MNFNFWGFFFQVDFFSLHMHKFHFLFNCRTNWCFFFWMSFGWRLLHFCEGEILISVKKYWMYILCLHMFSTLIVIDDAS